VFLGFGLLKFFPGVSPAESLVTATTDKLTFGLVPGHTALVVIAALECFVGLCMVAKRWMRRAIWLLALEFVGILSPLALLPGRLFSGPHYAPTLEGQYVLKDLILAAAGMVIAAATFRGGRLAARSSRRSRWPIDGRRPSRSTGRPRPRRRGTVMPRRRGPRAARKPPRAWRRYPTDGRGLRCSPRDHRRPADQDWL